MRILLRVDQEGARTRFLVSEFLGAPGGAPTSARFDKSNILKTVTEKQRYACCRIHRIPRTCARECTPYTRLHGSCTGTR